MHTIVSITFAEFKSLANAYSIYQVLLQLNKSDVNFSLFYVLKFIYVFKVCIQFLIQI